MNFDILSYKVVKLHILQILLNFIYGKNLVAFDFWVKTAMFLILNNQHLRVIRACNNLFEVTL